MKTPTTTNPNAPSRGDLANGYEALRRVLADRGLEVTGASLFLTDVDGCVYAATFDGGYDPNDRPLYTLAAFGEPAA